MLKQSKKHLYFRFILPAVISVLLSLCITGCTHKETEVQIPYQEVSLSPEALTDRYYYGLLEEETKLIYREILQGLLDHSEEIYLHSTDNSEVNELVQFVLNDYPEIFWSNGHGKTTLYQQGEQSYSVLAPEYSYSGDQLDKMNQALTIKTDEFLSQAPLDGTNFEKLKYTYDYIINQTTYDSESSDNQNICSVLINQKSVCAGYARTTLYLLNQLDIYGIYVTGTSTNPETAEEVPHAWNIVYCDGAYYHVDTTWGDPVYAQETENTIVYDYLCTNDEEIFRTHTPDASLTLPACTALDCNYYVQNGLYYTTYSDSEALQTMKNDIDLQTPEIIFKFSNASLYAEAKEDIMGRLLKDAAEYLARQYGLSSVKYSWLEDDTLCKLIIRFQYTL